MTMIAIYLPNLAGGGAERVMVTLANAFAARGYATDLVLVQAAGPYLPDVSPAVRIVDLAASRTIMSLPGLVRYLRRVRPAAMLAALTHANLVAIMAKRLARANTRLIVSERTTISLESLEQNRTIASRMVYALVPYLYPWADGIAAVSKAAAEDLARFMRRPIDTVRWIYNPFDLTRIQNLANEELSHPWFAPGAPPVVLGIGRLTRQKDFATLLQAFAIVRAQRPARLMILGEGELRAALQRQIEALGLTDDVAMLLYMQSLFRARGNAQRHPLRDECR